MLIDPLTLQADLDRLENIEKASLRLVTQAIYDYRQFAVDIFKVESDWVADVGEDITREALDRMGVSKIDARLYGKIDYKRARYLFHPDFAIQQALFVDSKAEKVSGQGTATLQTSQFSMKVQQIRAGVITTVDGSLPTVITVNDQRYITTTIFVKYNYQELHTQNWLESITIAALPNGFLQQRYNPSHEETIWLAGRNAPTFNETFRVRLSFPRLKTKANWRVQKIMVNSTDFHWED